MQNLITSKNKLGIIVACSILICIPIIAFVIKFRDQPISNNISDWSSFGGYIGGILNTLIAGISLVVLAYLTYFIGKQSNSETKNLNLLMRKLDAYESLLSHLPVISLALDNMNWQLNGLLKHVDDDLSLPHYGIYLENFFEAVSHFKSLDFFLVSFESRYSHLFDYSFNAPAFKKMLDASNEMSNHYDILLEKLSNRERTEYPSGSEKFRNLTSPLNELIKQLKKELR